MSDVTRPSTDPLSEQEALRAKSFRPPGELEEFPIEEVETSIPERFEKIVRMYPDRIAVETDTHRVTYAELNAMANRVAHAIVAERGDSPEPVGMLVEKGVDQMAAMLGILKAGKFFILLDPSFPAERISLVIEDCNATLLVVDRRTLPLTGQGITTRCKLIRIDAMAHALPTQDPKIPISPNALACIVYTSGSTGRPKGVLRNQRALLHGAMLRVHTDGISKNDKLAHITAGTSNSVTNSFYALLQGAALVTFDLKRDGAARLAGWLVEEKISVCLVASSVFRKLCTTLTGTEQFPDLRYLRLRSDTVYSSDVALHRKHFPPTCSLATGLASSETGPLREYRISHDTEFSGSEVPVGYALDGKKILLLNEDGEEVRCGETGEIVVRSDYLSLGYWNDPELTAEKFRPDPQESGKRLYYTGDLGMMLPDGRLIHRGRKDFRVKIRGYGVDLIEVESALRSHGDIKDAVVIAEQGKSRDARIIAYYASERQPGVAVDELRRFLGAKLADYMVPSAFVKLDALPLTSNGKVDRKALPEPGNDRPNLKEPYQSPRNATEQKLVEIWEGLLNVRPVGVHDNFFDLGGQSLLATQVVSRLREAVHVELPLRTLFENPTVAELAEQIQTQTKDLAPENMANLLVDLESLSDEEARLLLAQESSKAT
jgi:amino acid adenylation domain-containing protein